MIKRRNIQTIVDFMPDFKAAYAISKSCLRALFTESGYSKGYYSLIERACEDQNIERVMLEKGPSFAMMVKDLKGDYDLDQILTMSLSEVKAEKKARDMAHRLRGKAGLKRTR